jgi:hypothetical protein
MHDELKERYVPVDEHPGLGRDRESGAIVDLDHDAYQKYLRAKELRQQQVEKIDRLESRINTFESDISDIKQLLLQVLEKQNGHSI